MQGNITVYVWLPNTDRWGHASMQLSDGTYMSWWPPIVNTTEKSSTNENLQADIHDEESEPTETITIKPDSLDQDAIRKSWEMLSKTCTYSLTGDNCCAMLYKVLVAGGATQGLAIKTPQNFLDYVLKNLKLTNESQLEWNARGVNTQSSDCQVF